MKKIERSFQALLVLGVGYSMNVNTFAQGAEFQTMEISADGSATEKEIEGDLENEFSEDEILKGVSLKLQPVQISTISDPWEMVPGESKHSSFRITNPHDQPVRVIVELEDIRQSESEYIPEEEVVDAKIKLSQWIEWDYDGPFILGPNEMIEMKFSVNVPQSPMPSTQAAWFAVSSDVGEANSTGSVIRTRVATPLHVDIAMDPVEKLEIVSVKKNEEKSRAKIYLKKKFPFVEVDKVSQYDMKVRNSGNVIIKYEVGFEDKKSRSADLDNGNGGVNINEFSEYLMPGGERNIKFRVEEGFNFGKSEMKFSVISKSGEEKYSEEVFLFPAEHILIIISTVILLVVAVKGKSITSSLKKNKNEDK